MGHTAAPSHVLAGKTTTLVAHGACEQSNLTVIGSDVVGKAATQLFAENAITLQSAEQHDSHRSKNSSSGWNVGVTVTMGQNSPVVGITAGANKGKGYGNSDTTTHRHTHIGDATSLTTLHAGDTLHLKGAQVLGEQVQIQTPKLTIHSVQDTATYEGKQQNMGGQITVGYGVSGSAHFNRSSMKADYASVTEQSGIYAGDGGYQIAVDKHTDLKGGLITSTAQAEQQGKNRLTTGTLSASDIANHANVEGSSLGLSGSADIKGGWHGRTQTKEGASTHTASSGIGYGSDRDTQDSTTYSGINTKHLTITDPEQQRRLTGLTPQETADKLFTATTTDTAQALSGALENRFDAQALQKELDAQREVSETFSRNVQSARAELNQATDRLKADYERGVLSEDDYQAKRAQLENGSLLLGTIAAGLSAPTNSVLGITTASLSPSIAHQIGQYFKANGDKGGSGEGSAPHLLAHGLLAAAVAATGGNNALTAAGSAMTAEAAAPLLARYLYDKEANTLTADEKATISSISNLLGAGVGATTGTNANIVQGAHSALNAVEHNQFMDLRGIWGLDQWGPGAVALVDAKMRQNPELTAEELQRALNDYVKGTGYESGVSDGLVVWMVAPATGLTAGATSAIPSLGSIVKAYGLMASKSVAGGVGSSLFFNEDYKVSNLAYDLSVGVLIDRAVKKIIDTSGAKGLSVTYIDLKGKAANHFLGGGVSSAISHELDLKDSTLFPKINWPNFLWDKND